MQILLQTQMVAYRTIYRYVCTWERYTHIFIFLSAEKSLKYMIPPQHEAQLALIHKETWDFLKMGENIQEWGEDIQDESGATGSARM